MSKQAGARANKKPSHPRILGRTKTKPDKDLYTKLYRSARELVDTSYLYIAKFPRREKQHVGLGNDIKEAVNTALKQVIALTQYNPTLDPEREQLFRALSARLKFAETLVEIAYRQHYVSERQLKRWVSDFTAVDDIAIGLAMWYQGQK